MADKIVLTDEQKKEVVNAFKENDFTAKVPLKRKRNIVGENAKVFLKAKKFFGEYWLGNLRPLGVKRPAKKLFN